MTRRGIASGVTSKAWAPCAMAINAIAVASAAMTSSIAIADVVARSASWRKCVRKRMKREVF